MYLDLIDDSGESWTLDTHGADEVVGVVEIPDVLGIHLEEWREARHYVANPALLIRPTLLPLTHPLFQLGKEEVVVKLKEGFDIGEHLRNEILWEHSMGSVLLIDPELKHLQRQNKKKRQLHIEANFLFNYFKSFCLFILFKVASVYIHDRICFDGRREMFGVRSSLSLSLSPFIDLSRPR